MDTDADEIIYGEDLFPIMGQQ